MRPCIHCAGPRCPGHRGRVGPRMAGGRTRPTLARSAVAGRQPSRQAKQQRRGDTSSETSTTPSGGIHTPGTGRIRNAARRQEDIHQGALAPEQAVTRPRRTPCTRRPPRAVASRATASGAWRNAAGRWTVTATRSGPRRERQRDSSRPAQEDRAPPGTPRDDLGLASLHGGAGLLTATRCAGHERPALRLRLARQLAARGHGSPVQGRYTQSSVPSFSALPASAAVSQPSIWRPSSRRQKRACISSPIWTLATT